MANIYANAWNEFRVKVIDELPEKGESGMIYIMKKEYKEAEMINQQLQKQKQDACTMEDIERTRFHTGAEQAQKDAFAHLDRLIPRKENAFLFGAGK